MPNLNGIPHIRETTILKFLLKHVRSRIAKAILSEKSVAGGGLWFYYRTIRANQTGADANTDVELSELGQRKLSQPTELQILDF